MPFENINSTPIYIALGVGALLIGLAVWKKVLTIPATIAAFIVLVLATLFMSYSGLVAFAVSFVFAAIIGLIKREKRKSREQGIYVHEGARGIRQVLSNSLPALIYGAVYFATGIWSFKIAGIVTVATGIADSAASDVGILSDGKVISLINFKEVPRGISGGVSLVGVIASFITSVAVSVCVFLVNEAGVQGMWVIALCGFIGTVIDSVLGGGVQGAYKCVECGKITERKEHCGKRTELIKGFSFIDNDVVNVLSLIISGAISLIFYIK